VLFAGYQAPGTRGASLLAGSEEVKIHGRYVPVKAKIRQVEGLSSHADYAELIAWLRQSGISPRKTFVTHGDPAAADSFRLRLKEAFGWNAVVPREDEAYEIG
jgi:metallo-beta-lactamase family protein